MRAQLIPAGGADLVPPDDLTFLLHMADYRMRSELDRAAVGLGLTDVRDWLVLAALDGGQRRTQLELAHMVCLDKTTLISVLDRLEQRKLVVRKGDSADRRVRIPEITPAGRRVYARFASARDAVEARALDGVDSEQRALLLDILARIAQQQSSLQPAH
jgi:DNA-binding MarR family transcriptional regulator